MIDTRIYILPEGMTNEEFYKEQAEYWREIAREERHEVSRLRSELVTMTDLLNEAMWRMFDGDMREKVRAKVIEMRERGVSK